MTTVTFIRIDQSTDKAIKIIIRESGYDLINFKSVSEVSHWIPKSICANLTDNSVDIPEWFYNKNIAKDVYSSFMKSLKNS